MAESHRESFYGLLDRWPQPLQPGWYHADVGSLSLRELHQACQQADYLHLVHRNSADYDDLESYFTTCILYQYYGQTQPKAQHRDSQINVLGKVDLADGRPWQQLADYQHFSTGVVIPLHDFKSIIDTVERQRFTNTNVVVFFGNSVHPSSFPEQVEHLTQILRQRNNRFLLVRYGIHEPWAKLITDTLLDYPEWCFLHPECFEAQSPFWAKYLAEQMIWRWNYLYK
jgi:hypothetical protein